MTYMYNLRIYFVKLINEKNVNSCKFDQEKSGKRL